jgi:hypothetical protein
LAGAPNGVYGGRSAQGDRTWLAIPSIPWALKRRGFVSRKQSAKKFRSGNELAAGTGALYKVTISASVDRNCNVSTSFAVCCRHAGVVVGAWPSLESRRVLGTSCTYHIHSTYLGTLDLLGTRSLHEPLWNVEIQSGSVALGGQDHPRATFLVESVLGCGFGNQDDRCNGPAGKPSHNRGTPRKVCVPEHSAGTSHWSPRSLCSFSKMVGCLAEVNVLNCHL